MIPKYKDIADLIKKGATIEAQEKIMELREAALEIQEENINLKEEVSTLNKKNKSLQEELDKAKYSKDNNKLTIVNGLYYNALDNDGPFCTGCFDANGKKIRLNKTSPDFTFAGNHNCPVCKNYC